MRFIVMKVNSLLCILSHYSSYPEGHIRPVVRIDFSQSYYMDPSHVTLKSFRDIVGRSYSFWGGVSITLRIAFSHFSAFALDTLKTCFAVGTKRSVANHFIDFQVDTLDCSMFLLMLVMRILRYNKRTSPD